MSAAAEQITAILSASAALEAQATKAPWFVDHDEAEECGPHANSGLALVETGRSEDWPPARLCEWPTARYIASSRTMEPRLRVALAVAVAALVRHASYGEGEHVTGSFDEPNAALDARIALTNVLAALSPATDHTT